MAKKTQKDKIRSHLLRGSDITQYEATLRYRCIRLSAIVYELRHEEGMPIKMVQPKAPERPYAVYYIDKEWLRQWKRKKRR